ncbi:hypothetical protein CUJ83_09710 [Methanocella sp. CWC-04]|uniref:Long-chain-fatty-acyl-CoA reductase n=1 Tax=Methanooceanicella nereidis TaxID=2052831 RepID=A0AAP2W7K3_9EURY|nr:acyl-CoA reductase [Methanocella sp. CWC-04]MCD1295274.1 hypothetical protein [Methanocella sp. CWC-04]
MVKEFKGYYLPGSLEDVEKSLEIEERKLEDAVILVPRVNPEQIKKIVSGLKENREKISAMSAEEIADIYDNVSQKWKNNDYDKKKAALQYLPELTGLSPELIEYFQFRSIYKINNKTIKFLSDLKLNEDIFKDFVNIKPTDTYLRAYAGMFDKLNLKKYAENKKDIRLVTYITPSNVPGFIESLGIFLGNIVKASVLIKTPTVQPLFAPLFAESVSEASPILGETITVIPWKGGDEKIEDTIFRNSDVVSVVSGTDTALSVKQRIDRLNKEGYNIKGCYHGGKFGVDLIAGEMATREVAGLAAIDGIGYEGYMCASPAFGFFVEKGGKNSPEKFAEMMAEEGGKIAKAIPQRNYFKKLRDRKMAELIASDVDGCKIFTSPEQDFAVLYEPVPTLKSIGQNRLIRVMPVDRIEDIIPRFMPWKEYLQTAGIAIPDDRLLKIADKMGKVGFSNLRIVGTVPLPRLGEAWDGNFPVYEFYIPDSVHWVSINAGNMEKEITELHRLKEKLVDNGVFGLDDLVSMN